MPFSVLLDANVLFRIRLTDFLLTASEAGLFRVLWSDQILDEALRNAQRAYEPQAAGIAERFDDMRAAFPGALVEGYQSLVTAMTNDPKDRHVLAAGVTGRADVILTSDLGDFPPASVDPYKIEVQSPDEFCIHLWHLQPDAVLAVLTSLAAKRQRGTFAARRILDELEPSAPRFVTEVRKSGRLLP